MYAALHFPDLELHCILRHEAISPTLPIALLSATDREKSYLVALNATALGCGLSRGMTNLSATARCPNLYFLERDPVAEKHAAAELLHFAESLTPDFESTATNIILLDLSTLVIASVQNWIDHTLEKASHLRLPLHIATAPTPDLAHLRSLSPDLENAHPLALSELVRSDSFPVTRSDVEILHLWGIRSLGDLANLPRQGLSERLGPQLTWLHDVLHEKEHRLLTLCRRPVNYATSHDFESPIANFEPILFIARRLLRALCNRLRNTQRATSTTRLKLRYENGLSHRHTLTLTESTLDPEILLRALHTHLDTVRAPAPITGFSLRLIPVLPAHKQQEIFRKGLRDPHRFADTLHRLSALVGSDRIGIPQIQDTHRPDQFIMHPATPDFAEIKFLPVSPSGNLPLSRFRPPIIITVLTEKRGRYHHPLAILTGPHRGEILQTAGPYPLSGNWWDRTWQQIQWDIELPNHLLLRLTHTPPETWHLTGIYGT